MARSECTLREQTSCVSETRQHQTTVPPDDHTTRSTLRSSQHLVKERIVKAARKEKSTMLTWIIYLEISTYSSRRGRLSVSHAYIECCNLSQREGQPQKMGKGEEVCPSAGSRSSCRSFTWPARIGFERSVHNPRPTAQASKSSVGSFGMSA